jgi:hypothetical protein
MSLRWKIDRLRAMSAAEVAYRISSSLRGRAERMGVGLAPADPGAGPSGPAWIGRMPDHCDARAYRAAADRVLDGLFDVFSLRPADVGFPPQWNRDPKTGTVAPLSFGKSIDYRREDLVGDIKYLWEPSRHLQLVTLAQAWHLTGEARYAEGARALLESWFEQCPYPLGVHWTSSLEHAVRLLNWYFAWHLMGGEASPLFEGARGQLFKRRWQTSIGQHCHFIAGHFSRHSSANNHLLGEYMGLLVGSLGWPLWPQSGRWRDIAMRGFEQEALRQNAPDGVNREQAFYYHHEVAHMMLLAGLIGRANGVEFSAAFWQRLRDMLEFIACVMDVGGHVPMVGDADDARMVRLFPDPDACPYRMLLACGAVLFRSPFMARQARSFGDEGRWLLGDAATDRFVQLVNDPAGAGASAQRRRAFPEGGYYLLGNRFGEPDENRAVVDAGPLGYLSIAAHGHADALSFVLSVGGHAVLVDPGTYAYHAQRRWRDYFKGTSAHNTVRIDGMDQSVSGGNFLWVRHAVTRCDHFTSDDRRDRFVGTHDGYTRLPDPVVHRREIVFDKTQRTFEIVDHLTGNSRHDVELFWHLSEDCRAEPFGSQRVVARVADVELTIEVDAPGFVLELVRGRDEPPLGWISRRFDHREPTVTMRCAGSVAGAGTIRTRLTIRRRS